MMISNLDFEFQFLVEDDSSSPFRREFQRTPVVCSLNYDDYCQMAPIWRLVDR